MKKLLLLAILGGLGMSALAVASDVNDRVVRAALVMKQISETPDKGIPQDLLNKCACVAIIPGMKKGGFIFGANYGKGVMSCRTNMGEGPWSAPSMLQLHGGSFGLQIGGESVDLIFVIMNLGGIESLLNSKFTLGADASVAAGPVGRTAAAEVDVWISAKILAYSRARGLFGGLVVKGGSVRPDKDANFVLYGKQVEPRDILLRPTESVPKDAKILLDELTRISPARKTD